jgi:hypothetical protein
MKDTLLALVNEMAKDFEDVPGQSVEVVPAEDIMAAATNEGRSAHRVKAGMPADVFPQDAVTPEINAGGYPFQTGSRPDVQRAPRASKKAVAPELPEHERTTVMLRNIPNKYTQRMLLSVVVELGFDPSSFDFFYLPIDFRNKCNVGYMFINFLDHSRAVEFFRALEGYELRAFHSEKVCSVSWARVQGRERNIEHYRNSPIAGVPIPQYRPMIFEEGVEKPLPEADGPLPRVRLRVPKGAPDMRRNRKPKASPS